MTHEDRQGGRVTRLLVPAGIAAALVAGAVAYAGPASAATPPTVTLAMPGQLAGNVGGSYGTPGNATVTVTAGDTALTNTALLTTYTLPSGLTCANLQVKDSSGTVPVDQGSPANVCTTNVNVPTTAAGSTYTWQFTAAIDNYVAATPQVGAHYITGAMSTTSVLNQLNGPLPGGTVTGTLATSNAAPTSIVAPTTTAPAVQSPPAAIVHQDYSQQVITGSFTASEVSVYSKGTQCTQLQPTTTGGHLYALNDGLVLDASTGYVAATAATLSSTDSTPTTYVVMVGGGTANDTLCGVSGANLQAEGMVTIPVLFGDTAVNSLFGPAIYNLSDHGIINGFGDGDFHGQWPVTRDQFAAYIAKYAQEFYNKGDHDGPCTIFDPSAFTDVPNSSLFCEDIKFLSEEGIVRGYGNGTFDPSGRIVRQEMAAFIYRAHEVLANGVAPGSVVDPTCTTQPFPDVPTSNLFCGDIAWVASNHVARGYSDGTFRPKNGVARQEAAQFISNLATLEDKP